MRMFALIAVLLLVFTYNAFAADTESVAGGAENFTGGPDWELRLIPGFLGYSSYSGLMASSSADVAVNLGKRWQWELGAYLYGATRGRDHFSFYTGPRYNFSDDRPRSWFVGAAAEYGDRIKCCSNEKGFSGTVEVGKRFKINESGTWTWAPTIAAGTDGDSGRLSIQPANFTYSF